ncbi:hypothetical protein GCM10009555_040300 [Acrocarpospora macrocephala]|uniref:Glycosyltransferase RgtA/B/C/D-like domain-containing protein n=1 Tax=Acrocarpospora macrocephala TaxID=150177 RepID=A0A5M3WL42_9ACTN|nr:hypothetical protein [Acrocarpospora macrocephala]GES09997.1 hypothetical protein Amac_035930 [Acrocarpospora macrocephala]
MARHVRDNPLFVVLLAGGAALRLVTMLGFRPALWFGGDTDVYVRAAADLEPLASRPVGYSFLLRMLMPGHSFTLVVAVQHLLGLGVAVLVYLLLRRAGVLKSLAALLTTPLLFDAYQVQLEHLIMSDTLFGFLVVAAVAMLLWRPVPTPALAAAACLTLSLAAVTRTVGLPLLGLAVAYLLVRRAGWRGLACGLLAAAVPLVAYATWFHAAHGQFALSRADGVFLWSRTMTFADCSVLKPPPEEAVLCPENVPPEIRAERPAASRWIWNEWSPIQRAPGDLFSVQTNDVGRRFALRAIFGQPLDYAGAVARDTARAFSWVRQPHPGTYTVGFYEFDLADLPLPTEHSAGSVTVAEIARIYAPMPGTDSVPPYSSLIRKYQDYVFLRGPILALLLLAGLAGVLVRRRAVILFPWLVGVALLVAPPMLADFDHRYVLPAVPLLCLAAGLAAVRRSDHDVVVGGPVEGERRVLPV